VCGPREPQWERIGRNADRRRRSALYRISRNTARACRPANSTTRTLSVALLRRRSRLLANARVTARRRVLQAAQQSICHCTNPTAICQPAHPTPRKSPPLCYFSLTARDLLIHYAWSYHCFECTLEGLTAAVSRPSLNFADFLIPSLRVG
jgi:hypothetical protein